MFSFFLWFLDKFTCWASSASFAAYSSAILLKAAKKVASGEKRFLLIARFYSQTNSAVFVFNLRAFLNVLRIFFFLKIHYQQNSSYLGNFLSPKADNLRRKSKTNKITCYIYDFCCGAKAEWVLCWLERIGNWILAS